MTKLSTKLIGTTITSSAVFKDEHYTTVFPTSVNIKYRTPSGVITTLPVLPISQIYSAKVLLSEAGLWNFRWESTSDDTVADEFSISVSDTGIK